MILPLIFAIIAIVFVVSYIIKNAKSKDQGNKPGM
jgi:hypothetical protein